MGEASTSGRAPDRNRETGSATPRARLTYGQLLLQVDHYPSSEEAEQLARSFIPEGMELRHWRLGPDGDQWSLSVQWHAPNPSSADSTGTPRT
jgi:hypothetical protein